MCDKETRDPSREQLAFPDFKTRDGESANDTKIRMNKFMQEILGKYVGKRIAVISHGGAIKFYLLNYCNVNNNLNLEYKGKIPNTISGDGEKLDCYVLGVFEPLLEFEGKCIAIIHRTLRKYKKSK